MTVITIIHNNDLYNFNVSITGQIESIQVSRGNRCKPYHDISIEDLPDGVIDQLIDRQASGEHIIPTTSKNR